MNLKRGFVRLWVVLALVWVTAMTWLLWSELTFSKPFDVRSPDDILHEFPSNTSTAVINRTMKEYWQNKLVKIRKDFPEYNGMSDAELADALYKRFYSDMPRQQYDTKIGLKDDDQINIIDESRADWSRRTTALATLFMPPLVVFVVGAGLFWAGQGFVGRGR
jgi:hypothetical protein